MTEHREPARALTTAELLELYRIAQEVRKSRHDALWEIQKHFTWWVSIVFGAMFVVFGQPIEPQQKSASLTVLSVIGLVSSLVGLGIVRKEGEYFRETVQVCNRVGSVLGLASVPYPGLPTTEPYLQPNYEVREFDAVRKGANKSAGDVVRAVVKMSTFGKVARAAQALSVRDMFQVVLLVLALVFLAVLGTALVGGALGVGPLSFHPVKS